MQQRATHASKPAIPLFAGKPRHPSVPLDDRTAVAHNAGQGRPQAGACALPLTAVSTMAGWCRYGGGSWRAIFLIIATIAVIPAAFPVSVVAQTTTIVQQVGGDSRAPHIAEAAQRFGIPEHWIVAVLRAESAGDPRAVSSAGAMGLMQVMPGTWRELQQRYRFGDDPYNERDNILAGTAYLREMFDRYGNAAAMLAAYNAGPGRYDEHLATGRALPAETRAYVAALAPILSGDKPAERTETAPPTASDWRDAPLFVGTSGQNRP